VDRLFPGHVQVRVKCTGLLLALYITLTIGR
jgi:hypothetical protein